MLDLTVHDVLALKWESDGNPPKSRRSYKTLIVRTTVGDMRLTFFSADSKDSGEDEAEAA